MILAIMIIGIVGWITKGEALYMATAILGGLLLGFYWTAILINYANKD